MWNLTVKYKDGSVNEYSFSCLSTLYQRMKYENSTFEVKRFKVEYETH